jgi:hypothetical protein
MSEYGFTIYQLIAVAGFMFFVGVIAGRAFGIMAILQQQLHQHPGGQPSPEQLQQLQAVLATRTPPPPPGA